MWNWNPGWLGRELSYEMRAIRSVNRFHDRGDSVKISVDFKYEDHEYIYTKKKLITLFFDWHEIVVLSRNGGCYKPGSNSLILLSVILPIVRRRVFPESSPPFPSHITFTNYIFKVNYHGFKSQITYHTWINLILTTNIFPPIQV